MHENFKLLEINLRLFDGTAGGASAGGEGAAAEGTAQSETTSTLPKADTHRRNGSSRRSRSGEYDNVVFGKQAQSNAAAEASSAAEGMGVGNTNAEVTTTSNTKEAKRAAFKELIDGEYKDEYTELFQNAFNRRFKEVKGLENSLASQKPVMDLLMQRYNIGDGDVNKLMTALESDNRYYEEAADQAGMTVEQFRAMQKLERENAELKAMRQRANAEAQRNQQMQQAQQQLNNWYAEGDKLKSIYPTFDFQKEASNREFLNLLKSGVGVQHAYELIHMDEIKNATAMNAAKSASAQMQANIKKNSSRPRENGMSTQGAAIVKNDASKLTRKDRAEIVRRAARGDIIEF